MNDLDLKNIDFTKLNGAQELVPVVVQDVITKEVLMLGFQNEAAIEKTKESGKVVFYSRTKKRLWMKGETSGNFLAIKNVKIDCDNDTILYLVSAPETTCHLGNYSCFGNTNSTRKNQNNPDFNFLEALEKIICERIKSDDEKSYVKSLTDRGLNKVAQKVGEEGVEACIAGINETDAELLNESADLIFHLMILLKMRDLNLLSVVKIMQERHEQLRV